VPNYFEFPNNADFEILEAHLSKLRDPVLFFFLRSNWFSFFSVVSPGFLAWRFFNNYVLCSSPLFDVEFCVGLLSFSPPLLFDLA